MNTHNATINNGTYASDIGTTTIKAFCNDKDGFAIYAIGYTDNEDHKNVLTNPTLGSSNDIITGTATTGNSQWAMKLTAQSNPTPTYPLTIQNNYDSYHTVPSNYELVAKRTSATDIGSSAEGSTLTSTYQVYISPTQAAGTYTGQVKYVMVHPNNHDAPIANPAILDTGQTVNAKLKSLAATVVNGEETTIAYDAFYRGSNVIFYWEEKDYCMEQYGPSTKLMLNEENVYGDFFYSEDGLSDSILRNYNEPQSELYKDRYSRLVDYHDGNNTKRLIKFLKRDKIIR
jgi:hypothetical protein